MASTWPDVEGALRTYLRAHPDVSALVGTRVFFGVPDTPAYPLVVVQRVGGGEDISTAPIDRALVQVDCWAAARNKASATAVMNAVRQALLDIDRPEVVDTGSESVALMGAVVESVVWLAGAADDRPRYAITAEVLARKVVAA